jgi:hypothetical protein
VVVVIFAPVSGVRTHVRTRVGRSSSGAAIGGDIICLPASKGVAVPRTGAPTIDEESVIRLRNALLRTARRLRTGGDPEGLSASQSSVLATLVR